MPTVERYNSDSDKNGYFLTVNVGGPHPITLKSRPKANMLFSELGFGEKETITHNLCWAMYDAGLLYTGNSMDSLEGRDGDDLRDNFSGSLSNLELSQEEQERLAKLLNKYSDSKKIADLKSILDQDDAIPEATGDVTLSTSDDQRDMEDLPLGDSDLIREISGETLDEQVVETLNEWGAKVGVSKAGESGIDEYTPETGFTGIPSERKDALNKSVPDMAAVDETPQKIVSRESNVVYEFGTWGDSVTVETPGGVTIENFRTYIQDSRFEDGDYENIEFDILARGESQSHDAQVICTYFVREDFHKLNVNPDWRDIKNKEVDLPEDPYFEIQSFLKQYVKGKLAEVGCDAVA